MENNELTQLWQSYNEKLDMSLKINQKIIENTTDLRMRRILGDMKPIKIVSVGLGILWVILLDILIVSTFGLASPFFTVSAIVQVGVTKLAIGIYIYQLILIQQVDISEPIFVTQQKIAHLQSSTIWVARLLFLQFPVWSTFYLHEGMFKAQNTVLLMVQAIVTLSLTYVAVWLFQNIKPENKDKRWFKWIFAGKEWTPMIKAMELLNDLRS